jgi:hypothetical protein
MLVVGFDLETALIRPGCAAPPITCLSYCVGNVELDGAYDIVDQGLIPWHEARQWVLDWADVSEAHFVGHHAPFDFTALCAEFPDLLPLVFALHDDNRVGDTLIRQKLLDCARGHLGGYQVPNGPWVQYKYSLEALAKRHLKKQLDKSDGGWRLRYGELRDVPIDQWEPAAVEYAIEDAVSTFQIFARQETINKSEGGHLLVDECNQVTHSLALNLVSCWGFRTDPDKVDAFEKVTQKYFLEFEEILKEYGLVRSNGVRNTKAVRERLIEAMGGEENCRRTDPSDRFPKGQVALDSEACLSSGDLVLESYAEYVKHKAIISKDIPMLRRGTYLPIHTRFNSLLNTGRSSSSGDNIQNVRRVPGIREAFVPREGKVFVGADFAGLELRSLAEVCYALIGYSDMGDAINAGRDPHLEIAAYIMKIPYEEAKARRKAGDKEVDAKRQLGKVIGFGGPGGLGGETLTFYAKSNYGVILTVEEALELRDKVWKKKWSEVDPYFKHVNDQFTPGSSKATIVQLYSGRVRGGCTFTSACNTYFQGLGADAAKAALYCVVKACYTDEASPLYGSRVVNFIHDEVIIECDESTCHECAVELARLMEEGARPWFPHCPPKVDEPVVMRYWSKSAKQVWKDKRLVPWPA